MTPAANMLLPFIVISLGLLGIILSFMVPDRRKSMISLALAGLIILTGLIELGSQSISRYRWNRRMKEIQRDRQSDLEELRQKLKEKTSETTTPPAPAAPKKK